MDAYYNERDPYPAQWLRNLAAAGHIAPGIVDERSIEHVRAAELAGHQQCHFFAGIGVWSHALRASGWPDDRPVWTGSCPCQPFSAAGKGEGFADPRHLWPVWHRLIRECRPPTILGEQVANRDAEPWLDLVQADLEALGYAFGAMAFPAAGVGSPNIRDRLYWVAHARSAGLEGRDEGALGHECETAQRGGGAGRLAQPDSDGREPWRAPAAPLGHGHTVDTNGGDGRPGPVNCFWRDADWLYCRDGKWRPVEPGLEPLVNGAARSVGRMRADQEAAAALPRKDQGSRSGRLKGYGNAINAEAARIFIECAMQSIAEAA